MEIRFTATQTLVNGQALANEPTKKAIADQLKYMLFGITPS